MKLLIEEEVTIVRKEMSIEIDKYAEQVKVLLERLSRKEAEIRRLIIQVTELKEYKILLEKIKIEHNAFIIKLTAEFELKI